MSCECECLEYTTALFEELEKLSEENKSIQKALADIKLMLTEKKRSLKEELARERERTWK
jgi:CHASE3 domain sensor protein